MRGKSAFEATQPPLVRAEPPQRLRHSAKRKTPIRSVHEQVWNEAAELNWQ
jgi:hypothetical protein